MIPSSMKDQLSGWNGGRGIDLLSWIGCEGNFSFAVGYAAVFWPKFTEFEGYVLREGFSLESLRGFEAAPGWTRQSVEAVMNHLHIADIQHAMCEDYSPDKAIFLGETLAAIYKAKLALDFPSRRFEVHFFRPDNGEDLRGYELGFWQSSQR